MATQNQDHLKGVIIEEEESILYDYIEKVEKCDLPMTFKK